METMKTIKHQNGSITIEGPLSDLETIRKHYWDCYRIDLRLYTEAKDVETGEPVPGYPRIEIHSQLVERFT